MFHLFIVGDQGTQWDKILQEMHTKDPWIGVNKISHKGICIRPWLAFLDSIELHKLTILPVEAAEKQRYYNEDREQTPTSTTTLPIFPWSSTLLRLLREQRRATCHSMRLI